MAKKSKSEIVEGLHYSLLKNWVDGGKVDNVHPEIAEYLTQLTAVNGWHNQSLHKTQIIRRLIFTFKLDYKAAKNRWVDALNFFNLDSDLKYETYMKMYADKLDKITDLTIQTAKSPEDFKLAITAIKEAAVLRAKTIPKETIPEEFFMKPTQIFTIDIKDMGVHGPVNRNELGSMIDGLMIESSEISRVKQEVGLEDLQIFEEDEQESKD